MSVPLLGKRLQVEAPDNRCFKRRRREENERLERGIEQTFDYKKGPRPEDPKPPKPAPITLFSTATYEVKICTAYCGGSGQAHVEIGAPVPNFGKQRKEVLAVSAMAIEETFELLRGHCKAVHTFATKDQTVSLIFKEKLSFLKVKGLELFAINLKGRQASNADIVRIWEASKGADFKTNMQEQTLEIEGEMPDMEQAVKMYFDQGYTADEWPIIHGNALKARKEGNMTPFSDSGSHMRARHDEYGKGQAGRIRSDVFNRRYQAFHR